MSAFPKMRVVQYNAGMLTNFQPVDLVNENDVYVLRIGDTSNALPLAHLFAAAPALLEALKGLVGLECPITVKDPFGPAVVAHWTEQKAQGHGYAHLYLSALAAITQAVGGEA